MSQPIPEGVQWYLDLDTIFMKEIGMTHWSVEDYDWEAEKNCGNPPQDAYDEWYLIAGPGSMI